jgi:hypothetical protein
MLGMTADDAGMVAKQLPVTLAKLEQDDIARAAAPITASGSGNRHGRKRPRP